jgi:hypothetical protein
MILISHRGNISGPNPKKENSPEYIMEAVYLGYDVEIDIWVIDNTIFLGHDNPEYKIEFDWIKENSKKFWIHCKNVESLLFLKKNNHNFNFFWHENDKVVLTSKKNIWAFPTERFYPGTIAVLPEVFNSIVNECEGVCSDFIKNYNIYKSIQI